MERRRVLVVVAAMVAALGAVLVFLYVRGADTRAKEQFDTVQVLTATQEILAGEKIEDAAAAGKLELRAVTNNQLLPGYQTDTSGLAGQVAVTRIYPGEQIIAAKCGSTAAPERPLQIPKGMMAISVNLTDPARVAGFVNPGSEVSIFLNGTDARSAQPFSRLLLERVTVIGVGSTTPVSTTTTDESGASTTEQLPRTLLTLALAQADAAKVLYGQANGELSFALLTEQSDVKPGPATTFDNLFE